MLKAATVCYGRIKNIYIYIYMISITITKKIYISFLLKSKKIKINHPKCVFRCIYLKNICTGWHNLCQKKIHGFILNLYFNQMTDLWLKDPTVNRIKRHPTY